MAEKLVDLRSKLENHVELVDVDLSSSNLSYFPEELLSLTGGLEKLNLGGANSDE